MPPKLTCLITAVLMLSILSGFAIEVHAQRKGGRKATSRQSDIGKPRIAVLPVVTEQDIWATDKIRVAKGVQDVFVTELKKIGRFQVVEREQLQALMQEKNLTLSGDLDPSAAVRMGKLLGVNYCLQGSVGRVGAVRNVEGRRKPRGAAGNKMLGVVVKARLIDTSTGEIVWADEARAEESRSKVSVGGFGGGADDQRMFIRAIAPLVGKLVAGIKAAAL